MDAGEFLIKLWGNPPPGQVLVWTLPQKRSIWYPRLDNVQVGDYSHLDVYTGVGVAPAGTLLKSGQRATAEMIEGIAGPWADVDYAGKDHAKTNLPATEAEARELIDLMPYPPTIVVHTGHGLQAWWLFDKPWIFEDATAREEAHGMIRGWQAHMAKLAQARGWVVDSTHDLSRLMRLPGTVNNKSEPVPVTVLSSDGPRYSVETFWPYVQEGEATPVFEPVKGLNLDANVEPPFEKFLALTANEAKFKRSWERRRPDLPDQSASSYDMSLASFAVTAGWTDQETINLLIASRRHNGDDLKLREDYYALTIAKAKGPTEQAKAQERLEEEPTLADLSIMLGVEIIALEQRIGYPNQYWMKTSGGETELGGVHNIMNQARFRDAIADTTGCVIPKVKEALWAKRAERILRCCTKIDLLEASHPGDEMAHWVDKYLDNETILDDRNIAGEQHLPYRREDGEVLFQLDGLKQYLRFSMGETFSTHKLAQRLRLCGIDGTTIFVVIKGKETSRSYWGYIGH